MKISNCHLGLIGPTGILPLIIILTSDIKPVRSWENSDLEMFDLVEEVGQNFYEVLGVLPEASSKEIKQAYRRLSVKIHPDKNPEADAQTKFRQLVGIYEVLKDSQTREAYHTVLREGLPNWRQPIYYYRRYRKLALWQVVIIVLFFASLAQYLAGWASYWEHRLSLRERVEADVRRTQRTRKAQKEGKKQDEIMAELDKLLPKPSVWKLVPFQILGFCKYMIVQMPFDVVNLVHQYRQEKAEQEEERLRVEEETEKFRLLAEEPKKPRKRKVFEVPEKTTGSKVEESQPTRRSNNGNNTQPKAQVPVSGGLWTDEDIAELVKLSSKFPGGTPSRWETIASILNRPVSEVTVMTKKVLDNLNKSKPEEETLSEEGIPVSQLKLKVKTKGGKGDSVDRLRVENWSADEQKALENALQQYSKGVSDRWDKIATNVPGRSKEECMQRFKYLADLVKKKKEEEGGSAGPQDESDELQNTQIEDTELPQIPMTKVKLSKREKRRQRKQSSSSSSGADDWMVVDEEKE